MAAPRSCMLALLAGLALLAAAGPASAGLEIPLWLPRYDLDIHLDVDGHQARVRERVTWTNRHPTPSDRLVFNAHSHYQIPDKDVGFLAKTVEILRMLPSETMDFEGHACEVQKVTLAGVELEFHFDADNPTALVVALPRPVGAGESVAVDVEFTMRLPQKQGRWGQWKGVTFLAQWLPVLAYYDDKGWQPTPFIPWHQPFFNEAGVYHVCLTLPADQKVACTGSVVATKELPDGLKQLTITCCAVRDFALITSARFEEYSDHAGPVLVRCLALPEHEHYARELVRYACDAIPVYSAWFGPYPYPEFTLAESYFGWNGNECGGLVMIDERVFNMPHVAGGFLEYLVSHEICHQWWYNVIGTNGYCETWMDEGPATYFSHRLLDRKCGKNNAFLKFPAGLEWLPNIHRDTYRNYTLCGTLGRGENSPIIQEMDKFAHVVNLFGMAYDKGSRVLGMIETRMGEPAFLDFLHLVYQRYYFRILRVADLQHELEEYTGQSWDEFFRCWLYGPGLTDWCLEKVKLEPVRSGPTPSPWDAARSASKSPCKATVLIRQKGPCTEATVLGFCLDGGDGYQVRVPIDPQACLVELDDPPARVQALPDKQIRVEVLLPCKPTQIAVDPDQVLVDSNPTNNYWKARVHWRFTPLYTPLEETDITNAYDRWNVLVGPWVYGTAYNDPWYTRGAVAGLRAGLYRTQEFNGGAYLAYRTDYHDLAAGVDALWDHWPWPHTQVGFNAERSITTFDTNEATADRAVLFGRYVFQYSSSLYLPPMHYAELFGTVQNHYLPWSPTSIEGAERVDHETAVGVHYHVDYMTPYWDPEGGYRFDTTYAYGVPIWGQLDPFNQLTARLAVVKCVPGGLGWLSETKVAAQVYGAVGLPNSGQYFTLGGSQQFRGFGLGERQGSVVWVGNLEWRLPIVRGLCWDCCDHAMGLRNLYGAVFYDVGDAYLRSKSQGPVAHAVGAGLRFDVAWFSLIERTILRLDVAKAVNSDAPVQVWFGVQHPF